MPITKGLAQFSKPGNATKVALVLSVFNFLFYLSVQVWITNVYQHAFVGALFELLSIPMFLLLIFLPIISLVQLINGSAKRYAVTTLLVSLSTVVVLLETA